MIKLSTERLRIIFSELTNCQVFADIGCDHGYMAKAMIDSSKCERAIISDISKKCLEKAEKLLAKEIKAGKVLSVVGNGFEKIENCDLALVAGMGGEEIVKIMLNAKTLPDKLVVQPMKNTDKVRLTAVSMGYKIVKDYLFWADKIYYDLIVLEKGTDTLTDDEIEFGRTNILERNPAFIEYLTNEIKKIDGYLSRDGISEDTKKSLKEKQNRYKKYVES